MKHSNLTAWQFPHKSLCQHWAVVTTIFAPTVSILKQAHMSNWCMVIVADKKGPKTYTIPSKSNYIYLTVEMQTSLAASSHMLKHLPWNHFSRKNIGFLYAVMNNAQAVYDFDDDNCLLGKHHIALPSESSGMSAANTSSSGGESVYYVRRVKGSYNHSVFNPYPVFGGSGAGNGGNLWPRGYPLDLIKETYPGTVLYCAPPAVPICSALLTLPYLLQATAMCWRPSRCPLPVSASSSTSRTETRTSMPSTG